MIRSGKSSFRRSLKQFSAGADTIDFAVLPSRACFRFQNLARCRNRLLLRRYLIQSHEVVRRMTQTRGLLGSISGFTKGVIEELKRKQSEYIVFLFDRDELMEVLRGVKRFESLIDEKQARTFLH